MAKILEFRPPAPKPLTPAQRAAEVLNPKQAVDLMIIDMIQLALPKWIEREWPFMQLERMADELRYAMEDSFPHTVTRGQVENMIVQLRPTWEELIREVDPSLFW